jgi:Leucine-rich repeat (LRR) protein
MRLKFCKKYKFLVKTIKVVLVLIIISGCKYQKSLQQSDKNICSGEYFYLVKDEYGKLNSEGNVLLHLSTEDSVLIQPEKVCSLQLYPTWKKKEFPYEVLAFSNLEYLWVAMRDFKVLPNEIIQLKQLKYLDLQNSGVTTLSENIGELKNLEELILLFSDIETLPISICELSNLKRIHLGGTKIKTLPSCLKKLTNLEEFILFYENESEFSPELKLELDELQKHLKNCWFALN